MLHCKVWWWERYARQIGAERLPNQLGTAGDMHRSNFECMGDPVMKASVNKLSICKISSVCEGASGRKEWFLDGPDPHPPLA